MWFIHLTTSPTSNIAQHSTKQWHQPKLRELLKASTTTAPVDAGLPNQIHCCILRNQSQAKFNKEPL
jgi:hypothetical protein